MKTALITGAAGGIGQAMCLAFRRAGFRVIGTDLKQAIDHCDVFIPLDLTSMLSSDAARDDIIDSFQVVLEDHGLDVLVNNAAVQVIGRTSELSVRDWQTSLDVNVVAPVALIQGLLSDLKRARGSVINVASIHATQTKPGFAAYATSKAAMVGMTRSLAVDLEGSVRVNCISPAATATTMLVEGFEGREEALQRLGECHPMGRIADPSEVARTAVFLASADASFINGAALDVDGGIGARLHDPE